MGAASGQMAGGGSVSRRRALSYTLFERLVLVVAAVAVGGTVLASVAVGNGISLADVTGALLVFVVLAAAVHWGRNGGFIAAAGATLLYSLMAVPSVVVDNGLQPQVAQLVLVHVVVYGLVGVVGGEVCGRLKYTFARLESSSALDEDSRLYSEPMLRELMHTGVARFRRYGTPLSVIRMDLSHAPFNDLRPLQRRALLRRVAAYVRNDLRLVDDVGRLDDGALLVLLPSTPGAGAEVVAARLRSGIADLLETKSDAVGIQVMSTDRDPDLMERTANSLSASFERGRREQDVA